MIVSSLQFLVMGLCIIAIMISCVWDQTSVNHQFYYIYFYYDESTKPKIELHTEEILNRITDTILLTSKRHRTIYNRTSID